MNVGMLWFDNDPKSALNDKIERAATYYRKKYGRTPTLCFVHPSMVASLARPEGNSEFIYSGGMELRSARSVLPNHFWIGIKAE